MALLARPWSTRGSVPGMDDATIGAAGTDTTAQADTDGPDSRDDALPPHHPPPVPGLGQDRAHHPPSATVPRPRRPATASRSPKPCSPPELARSRWDPGRGRHRTAAIGPAVSNATRLRYERSAPLPGWEAHWATRGRLSRSPRREDLVLGRNAVLLERAPQRLSLNSSE